MSKYQEAIEILINRNEGLKLNHKIGSRDIANSEVKEITMAIDYVIKTMQEQLKRAKKEHELLELYREKEKLVLSIHYGDYIMGEVDHVDFSLHENQKKLLGKTLNRIEQLEEELKVKE